MILKQRHRRIRASSPGASGRHYNRGLDFTLIGRDAAAGEEVDYILTHLRDDELGMFTGMVGRQRMDELIRAAKRRQRGNGLEAA